MTDTSEVLVPKTKDELIAVARYWAKSYGIPFNFLCGCIEHESDWNPAAIGDGGLAKGLMQMHPDAAKDVGIDWKTLDDPDTALMAGCEYLLKCWHWLGRPDDWHWVFAAYNQGPGVIGKALKYSEAVQENAQKYR